MNRRILPWVLLLAVAIWLVALIRATPQATVGQKRLVAQTPTTTPSMPPEALPAPRLPSASRVLASEARSTTAARPPNGTIAADDPYRKKLAGLIAEQRRLSAERFARADQRWPQERRAEPWATQREKELRSAMEHDQIDSLIDAIECRETLCRLELAAQDSNAAIAFNGAHELQRQLGKQLGSAMTGGGLDRRMILFVAREDPH